MLKIINNMKNITIKHISLKKSEIIVHINSNDTNDIVKEVYPNNKETLFKIYSNIIKKVWVVYPSTNNGLWKYLHSYILQYCKENNIYISDKNNLTLTSDLFNVFLSKLNECVLNKNKFQLKTKSNYYIKKRGKMFTFTITENIIQGYKFTYCEKELFKIENKNNPIFSNIIEIMI